VKRLQWILRVVLAGLFAQGTMELKLDDVAHEISKIRVKEIKFQIVNFTFYRSTSNTRRPRGRDTLHRHQNVLLFECWVV
jgi:hypothetical protein